MSLTLTLSGKSTVLAANYFPAIDLSDDDYELGLVIFETYHTIPNVNNSNNKFYFAKDDVEITIPEGSYEVRDINEFLKRAILRKSPHRDALETVDVVRGDNKNNDADDNDNGEDGEYPITLRANYNTMRCEIRCALWDSRCATFEMTDILNIKSEPVFDDRIVKIETHTYNPFANTTFGYSDEIRIPIQQQDLYTLPYESFLYVEGKLTKNKVVQGASVSLGNNCVAFIFDEIRYELNGVEIDRNRNVGITSTIKNYVTVSSDRSVILRNAGWDAQTTAAGYFNFCVPLYVLLGFCEDYRRVVINARHELILIRARNDNNCLTGDSTTEPTLELFKVQWRMPHVLLSEINKLSILRALESGRYLSMAFRSWDLYEFPLLQSTTKHSWAIKTASQLEKPRYVIFAMQTGRKNIMSEDASRFDHCKLTNAKLYLNTECYPYDDLNLDFDKNRCAILYDFYARFCKGYYGYEYLESNLTFTTFLRNGPFVIINCSRQNESVKSGTVRLDFECKENVPANTTAYCLIIHDRVVQYTSMPQICTTAI
ncbi:hypothetical protein ALC56_03032 [Trachymyrmex septentrionalis]|uniref:Double jelly roll-like domain-containing protein n=2 Tax=Trachymyrmex septentrionalis TaxID=34720 RepID=A0A195FPZ7_9HYME|nr:hypothetical protein ALC56_03032 [Trachymyrmex septentrionalis]